MQYDSFVLPFFCTYSLQLFLLFFFFNTLFCIIFVVENYLTIFLTLIFFPCVITLSLLTVMFAIFLKCTLFCFRYAA